MTQQLLSNEERERPALIVPITLCTFLYSTILLGCGVLSLAGNMSMRLGAQLLGGGLEVMGPVPYFIFSIAFAAGAWGLLRTKNWARRLMIVLCTLGVVLLVPHISSAVVDERWIAMSVDGLQILTRVAIASYLWREAEWFESRAA